MEAIVRFGSSKSAGLVGSLISVALVLCGATGRAEGITRFNLAAGEANDLVGGFSGSDLEQLEHATAAEATAARLATFGAEIPELANVGARKAKSAAPAVGVEEDLFPHSGRLVPMLVDRPGTAAPVVMVASSLRSGLVRPVGVPLSSLQSTTATGR